MSNEAEILKTIAEVLPNAQCLANDAYRDPHSGLIINTDMMVEGTHFHRRYCPPEAIGWKLAMINWSDIAASAGLPAMMTIGLGGSSEMTPSFVRQLYQGVLAANQQVYQELLELQTFWQNAGLPILEHVSMPQVVGGDTVYAPTLTLCGTVIGYPPQKNDRRGCIPARGNAQPGDVVVTTGHAGLSAAGLWCFQHQVPGNEVLKQAHLKPPARVGAGLEICALSTRVAMMDSSDGLADALIQLAETSGVEIEVDARLIPIHSALQAFVDNDPLEPSTPALWDWVFYGGEDFELVATLSAEDWDTLKQRHLQTLWYPIGRVTAVSKAPQGNVSLMDTPGNVRVINMETHNTSVDQNHNASGLLLDKAKRFNHFTIKTTP